jgi:hypothetical protein
VIKRYREMKAAKEEVKDKERQAAEAKKLGRLLAVALILPRSLYSRLLAKLLRFGRLSLLVLLGGSGASDGAREGASDQAV